MDNVPSQMNECMPIALKSNRSVRFAFSRLPFIPRLIFPSITIKKIKPISWFTLYMLLDTNHASCLHRTGATSKPANQPCAPTAMLNNVYYNIIRRTRLQTTKSEFILCMFAVPGSSAVVAHPKHREHRSATRRQHGILSTENRKYFAAEAIPKTCIIDCLKARDSMLLLVVRALPVHAI